MVRASDCLCKRYNSPGFNPSIFKTQKNQRGGRLSNVKYSTKNKASIIGYRMYTPRKKVVTCSVQRDNVHVFTRVVRLITYRTFSLFFLLLNYIGHWTQQSSSTLKCFSQQIYSKEDVIKTAELEYYSIRVCTMTVKCIICL